jgi:hypothetical protein
MHNLRFPVELTRSTEVGFWSAGTKSGEKSLMSLSCFSGTAMPLEVDVAERWRTLAAEARAAADEMTDPESKRALLRIAEGYERLARRAEARKKNQEDSK